jgi:hypothetical protein
MRLNLTPWQRVYLENQVVGQARGLTAKTFFQAAKLLAILELDEEEKAEVGYTETPVGPRWARTDRRWEIEIPDGPLVDFFLGLCRQHTGWPAAPAEIRQQVADLLEQLGMGEEDDHGEG